jgi:hypothetical protein
MRSKAFLALAGVVLTGLLYRAYADPGEMKYECEYDRFTDGSFLGPVPADALRFTVVWKGKTDAIVYRDRRAFKAIQIDGQHSLSFLERDWGDLRVTTIGFGGESVHSRHLTTIEGRKITYAQYYGKCRRV